MCVINVADKCDVICVNNIGKVLGSTVCDEFGNDLFVMMCVMILCNDFGNEFGNEFGDVFWYCFWGYLKNVW